MIGRVDLQSTDSQAHHSTLKVFSCLDEAPYLRSLSGRDRTAVFAPHRRLFSDEFTFDCLLFGQPMTTERAAMIQKILKRHDIATFVLTEQWHSGCVIR